MIAVYPRAYGGTLSSRRACRVWRGLSPRVRGNRSAIACERRILRSIPARTGEPGKRTCSMVRKSVYPRAYGGTLQHGYHCHAVTGLSPRVRGNPAWFGVREVWTRSIPARTGEPA